MSETPQEIVPYVPTQLAYPVRTIIRGIVQNLVGLFLAWLAGLGVTFADPNVAIQLVEGLSALVWFVGTALATWIMTRPRVAQLLRETILAPSPASPAPRHAI